VSEQFAAAKNVDKPSPVVKKTSRKNYMGLFDKMLGGQSSSTVVLDKREALASILLVTVASDGHVSDDETGAFNATINRMALYQSQSGAEFSSMLDKLIGLLKKQGHTFLLEKAAASLPPELRETAFALATDLVFADGHVETEEKELLEEIQQQLKIPDDLALKIIEVLQIKNRG
jgi:uncharacterized tellurite resistance protein B-like protein